MNIGDLPIELFDYIGTCFNFDFVNKSFNKMAIYHKDLTDIFNNTSIIVFNKYISIYYDLYENCFDNKSNNFLLFVGRHYYDYLFEIVDCNNLKLLQMYCTIVNLFNKTLSIDANSFIHFNTYLVNKSVISCNKKMMQFCLDNQSYNLCRYKAFLCECDKRYSCCHNSIFFIIILFHPIKYAKWFHHNFDNVTNNKSLCGASNNNHNKLQWLRDNGYYLPPLLKNTTIVVGNDTIY